MPVSADANEDRPSRQVVLAKGGKLPTTLQRERGSWEKMAGVKAYLLCQECERLLNEVETPIRKLLYGNSSPLTKVDIGTSIAHRQVVPLGYDRGLYQDYRHVPVNYDQLKRFQLSLLWRAGVSKGPWGRAVRLGENHQENLRQMLLSKQPGKWTEYPCTMFSVRSTTFRVESVCEPFHRLRFDGRRVYRTVVGGYVWTFEVTSHAPSENAATFAVRENGDMFLLVVNDEILRARWRKGLIRAGAKASDAE